MTFGMKCFEERQPSFPLIENGVKHHKPIFFHFSCLVIRGLLKLQVVVPRCGVQVHFDQVLVQRFEPVVFGQAGYSFGS
jgi:hypothetical protein